MIKGVHTMFYSSEPEALRAFLRDKLGFSICTNACTSGKARTGTGPVAGTNVEVFSGR